MDDRRRGASRGTELGLQAALAGNHHRSVVREADLAPADEATQAPHGVVVAAVTRRVAALATRTVLPLLPRVHRLAREQRAPAARVDEQRLVAGRVARAGHDPDAR